MEKDTITIETIKYYDKDTVIIINGDKELPYKVSLKYNLFVPLEEGYIWHVEGGNFEEGKLLVYPLNQTRTTFDAVRNTNKKIKHSSWSKFCTLPEAIKELAKYEDFEIEKMLDEKEWSAQ
ncbi:hypothetical protein [Clostridium cellulovorans]|uniref:Uncharacterized protein n=1 Tax=Clostridium cellulovorans (strain ATCC 35296 / DSM 3052 / OCM 3 / 743B) TaxID=573061 RepID=D9SRS9_CLOC7|nr:hypothetical protein [Clostridium cellulovorans]ADL50446.1 hypothetical protein Clocel_0675 [Clostridium cellulovorans 743B]